MPLRDREFYLARIERTKAIILAYEDAIEALSSGAQTYHLDTGQTRQSVTRAQLSQLRTTLAYWENRLTTLQARLHGAGVVVGPGF